MRPLDCPFCEHQNPAGAKFCNDCGSPLHLTPCEQCGAVNNLTDPHCWRCGGLLLPLHAPAPTFQGAPEPGTPEPRSPEFERSRATERAALELEQELAALEQETRQFAEPSGSAAHAAPIREPAETPRPSDAPPVLDDVIAPRRRPAPRPSRAATAAPPRFDAAPLTADAPAWRDERWRGLIGATSVTVFIAAIVGGGYFYYRIGGAPAPNASTPPSEPPRVAASIEPRVAHERGTAPAAVPAPEVASTLPRADAPVEPRAVKDISKALEAERGGVGAGSANIITRIGAGAAAPALSCPPAVEAMALCEWLVRADRH